MENLAFWGFLALLIVCGLGLLTLNAVSASRRNRTDKEFMKRWCESRFGDKNDQENKL